MNLSIAIAQTQTEHDNSPSITHLTIQCACQNSVINETSADGNGKAACATSAGFISGILSREYPNLPPAIARDCDGHRSHGRVKNAGECAGAKAVMYHKGARPKRGWLPLPTCQNE